MEYTFTQPEETNARFDRIEVTQWLRDQGVTEAQPSETVGDLHAPTMVQRVAEFDASILASARIVFTQLHFDTNKTATVGFVSQEANDAYCAAWRKMTYGK